MRKKSFFAGFLLIILCLHGQAQSSGDEIVPSTQFDTSEFPLWVRDLRRAEIVAFGSFPFSIFFATFVMDTIRYANHGADASYAPWPFKLSGAIDMNRSERSRTILAAAITSLAISLADYIIVRYKRNKADREVLEAPGEPIIIRRPWPGTETGSGTEAGSGAAAGSGTADGSGAAAGSGAADGSGAAAGSGAAGGP
jgi:hypothetical protein